MQDEPTPIELTRAVVDFLREDIAPMISGHHAFKLRVAINILELVIRQSTLQEGSDAKEAERLTGLLAMNGSLMELNRVLAERIAEGALDLSTAGLAEHLQYFNNMGFGAGINIGYSLPLTYYVNLNLDGEVGYGSARFYRSIYDPFYFTMSAGISINVL